MRILSWLLAFFFVLPLSGLLVGACGGPQTPESRFEEHLRTYHDHMRWARWEEAAEYVTASKRFEFLGEMEEYGDDYQVTEYEIRSINLIPRERVARVSVWVQSFRLPSTRVEEITWIEDWEFNEDRKLWEMQDRRKRGDRERRESDDERFQPEQQIRGGDWGERRRD